MKIIHTGSGIIVEGALGNCEALRIEAKPGNAFSVEADARSRNESGEPVITLAECNRRVAEAVRAANSEHGKIVQPLHDYLDEHYSDEMRVGDSYILTAINLLKNAARDKAEAVKRETVRCANEVKTSEAIADRMCLNEYRPAILGERQFFSRMITDCHSRIILGAPKG